MQSGGGRYEVQTGRREGFVSLASNVDLPSPSFSVSQSADAFAKKGIDLTEMVLLLGIYIYVLSVTELTTFFDCSV